MPPQEKTLEETIAEAKRIKEELAKLPPGVEIGAPSPPPPPPDDTVAAALGIAAPGVTPPPGDTKAILDWMKKQMDIITTEPTDIEEDLDAAALKAAREAEEKRIESVYGRLIEERERIGVTKMISAREAQRGFATNQGMLRQIEESTTKAVEDLRQRREEAIKAGNLDFALQLERIELQERQFAQTQKQQAFQNMLAMGTFGLSMAQEERMRQQAEVANQMTKLSFLSEQGLLADISPEQQATYETDLGLPSGILAKVVDKPDITPIQIGNTAGYIETDPETGRPVWRTLFTASTEYAPSEIEREWTAAGEEIGTGQTLSEYIATVRGIGLPRDWSDDEFNAAFRRMEAEDKTYQEALDEIAMDRTIKNKERGRELAAKYFGIIPEEAPPKVKERITPEMREKVEKGELIIGPEGTLLTPEMIRPPAVPPPTIEEMRERYIIPGIIGPLFE